ncbi:hypothetical protein HXX76_011992 [Chlamydomonas incerta]|uniref:Syntaxin 6/10/61 N-terminal domain-containing protein n=1 Tax=Chlamydomonas incerta TaxID=51695 RepID=A0A835VWS4_CHLIN|nr:hypothetical protein HXX76_011992 [Chlamydomonas incerta]|eukprot:KAG2428006.1 hypothetical protein HXX76_011992 [Chlamydomonas incerta]
MLFVDPFNIVRADIDEQVRLLARGDGELQAALSAEASATATGLAEKLGDDCDDVLVLLVEVEQALEIAAATPHRFNILPEELQARQAWFSATRDAVRRTAEHVAPHRPLVRPRLQSWPQRVATAIFIPPAPSPYSAAPEPCCKTSIMIAIDWLKARLRHAWGE